MTSRFWSSRTFIFMIGLLPCRRTKLSSTFVRKRLKYEADYVIRRFNLFSAQLNKPQGLDLR
jgi:hypothetical protein